MNNLKAKVKNILKLNSRQGWAVLFTVIFLMIISSAALMGPALRTTSHIQNGSCSKEVVYKENE